MFKETLLQASLQIFRVTTCVWADHSPRGVVPNVMCHVWYINLKNEAGLARFGLLRKTENKKLSVLKREILIPHQEEH